VLTIEQYQSLFGPHDENELILQLRLEGVREPLTETPAADVIKRINQRLLAPAKNRSLFMCFLRGAVRRLKASNWRIDRGAEVQPTGFRRIQATAGTAVLTFEFAAREHFIERVLDEHGEAIAADRFISECRPDACCPR